MFVCLLVFILMLYFAYDFNNNSNSVAHKHQSTQRAQNEAQQLLWQMN